MDSATLNTISLCSGVAMLDEGVHAGLEFLGIRSRTVVFAEREAYAVGVLEARMEEGSLDAAPIWFGDFTELPARRFRGLVDGVVAGFPCQDLSVAGRRAGLNGKRSGLFFNVLDIADDSGAWFLVLENVAGISSATASVVDEASAADYAAKSDGSGFSDVGIEDGMLFERACARVMGELADRGWNAEWITLSASDVGASHGRARWFCFAWRQVADPKGQRGRVGQRNEFARRAKAQGAGEQLDHAYRIGEKRAGREESGADSGCEELADTRLQHSELQQREVRTEHQGGGVTVGDSKGFRDGSRNMRIGVESAESSASTTSPPMAHTDGGGRWIESGHQQQSSGLDRRGALLADASSSGPQRLQRSGGASKNGREIENGSTSECGSIFAPGPTDARWPGLLARFPWLAPAIGDQEAQSILCGESYGLEIGLDFSYRAARLRACGNGVVPACAASALIVLVRRSGIFQLKDENK